MSDEYVDLDVHMKKVSDNPQQELNDLKRKIMDIHIAVNCGEGMARVFAKNMMMFTPKQMEDSLKAIRLMINEALNWPETTGDIADEN